jgi:hypothetical protein
VRRLGRLRRKKFVADALAAPFAAEGMLGSASSAAGKLPALEGLGMGGSGRLVGPTEQWLSAFEENAGSLGPELPTLPSHEVAPAIQYGKFADRGGLDFDVPRTIYAHEGKAYYVSSGQARNLPGQIDKGVGKSFRIWGIQEQTFGQLHEGWIGKQVLNAGDLAEAADTVQHNIVLQFDGILESPADVNAWLRSQGVPAFDSVPDNWPL